MKPHEEVVVGDTEKAFTLANPWDLGGIVALWWGVLWWRVMMGIKWGYVAGIAGNNVGSVVVMGNVANLGGARKGSSNSHALVVNLSWLVST